MNKLKKFGIIFLSLIVGLYVLFLISPVIVSPVLNAKREMVRDIIKESTGFDAQIEGITLVTAWNFAAGVKIKEFQLTLPDSEKPFLYAQNTGLKLSLLPILGKKIRLDSLFSDAVYADIIVKEDGSLQLLDYLPEQKNEPKESFTLPMGIKLSNKLPSIFVKNYRLAVIDKRSDRSYFMEGEDFRVTNFVLDKRIKFSTKGKVVFDETVISNYDLKIDNRIMPNLQLHDLVFPADMVVEEVETTAEQNISESVNLRDIVDLFKTVKSNQFAGNLNADLKIAGNVKNPKIDGHFSVDALTVAVDGKKLPESFLNMKFKGNKTDIDSVFYSSSDKNEKTSLTGELKSGKKPYVNLALTSNAKFKNVVDLVDSIAQSFNIQDFKTLTATGSLDADFKLKSDFKKVESNGYLKVLPATLSYGLYNITINDITADVDLENNDINIKKAGFSILGQPLKLSGSIKSDTTTDLKLTADKLSIKGLLLALGQASLLKENEVSSGLVSLNAIVKGKLQEIKPEIDTTVENINILNKPADARVTLANALVKILYDGKTASGNIDVNSFGINFAGSTISVPKALVQIDEDKIDIKNSYLMLNNSRIDVTGNIKDYLNDKMAITLNANGNLQSADVAAFLPKEFRSLISYKGKMPLKVALTGNSKVQNISADLTANPSNYIALVDIAELKGQQTKIHSNIEINGDTLTLSNTGLTNDKTSLAKVGGEVTKLYSSPKLNINISVPNSVSFPIWGVANSNITANGNVTVSGNAMAPNMKGTVSVADISMKDLDFAISNLAADLSGAILNGSATAKKFKVGGIVATDLAAKFSLKDYTRFYLTDATAKAFDGDVSGKLSYDISTTKVGVEFAGSGLDSTKAVEGAVGIKNALTGVMGFSGKLTMQGVTDKEIINSMKGNINFNVQDGKFVNIGRLENFVAAQNVTSNSILKGAISALSTLSAVQEADKFKYINGEMTFANGTAKLSKILVSGPLMAYYVSGTYDILPNSANLVILGRLEAKVISCLGPLGQLSADKLLSYIPSFGTTTAGILKQMTSDPASENTSLIPALSGGSTSYKDFKVTFNGPVESASSVKNFKWLSTCDVSEMNLKQDLENAKEAVQQNITNTINETKTKVENVQKNVTNVVETQKQQVQQTKQNIEQAKNDIVNAKENVKQNADNLKNLFQNALKNSQTKVPTQEE